MTATIEKTTGATKKDILGLCREQGVAFLRLQFTDILGINKNFEVPESQFEKALEGDIRFDGSAIEGFVRIEESDMVLKPDLETFRILPYDDEGGAGRAAVVRHLQSRRNVVRRLPAPDLEAANRAGGDA